MKREGMNPWNPEVHLAAQDTKLLMSYLDGCRKYQGQFDILGDNSGCVVTIDQVKAALEGRPHIPNKLEAKALRRIMAKTGMSADDVRKVPKYQTELADAARGGKAEATA